MPVRFGRYVRTRRLRLPCARPASSSGRWNLTAKDLQADLNAADGSSTSRSGTRRSRPIARSSRRLGYERHQPANRCGVPGEEGLRRRVDRRPTCPRLTPGARRRPSPSATQPGDGRPEGRRETLTRAAESEGAGRDVSTHSASSAVAAAKRRGGAVVPQGVERGQVVGQALVSTGPPRAGEGRQARRLQYLDEVLTVDPVSTEAAQARTELDRLK